MKLERRTKKTKDLLVALNWPHSFDNYIYFYWRGQLTAVLLRAHGLLSLSNDNFEPTLAPTCILFCVLCVLLHHVIHFDVWRFFICSLQRVKLVGFTKRKFIVCLAKAKYIKS